MAWLLNSWSVLTGDKATEPIGTGLSSSLGASTFAAGEIVEYYSTSQNAWILAKVLEANPSGTYNLDCKPDVPQDKIRRLEPRPPASVGETYSVNEVVEYYSASQGGWIMAKVLAVNPTGTYTLDCKPDVSADKIRKLRGPPGSTTDAQTLRSGAGGAPPTLAGSSLLSSIMAPAASWRAAPAAAPLPTGPLPTGPLATAPLATGLGDLDAPVQLLRVHKNGQGWRYEVCEEGARVLEQHGARRIAVVSICGLYRTGKSYLLNLLLERVQHGKPLFQVGGTTRACTEGLWLWGSPAGGDPQSPLLAFLDCEGFGSTESDKTRDAQLMTLCALLSSVLVLNTRGVLNEGLFNSLSLTCKFAEHIEERGNEANRPALCWVLRDFVLDLQDPSGRSISPDEYLEQQLNAAPLAGFDQERGKAAREVRQSLLQFFPRRSCVTLVQPIIDEGQLQRLTSLSYSSLRGEFRTGIETLRSQLVSTSQANSKSIGGQPLGCAGFVALLRQFTVAMNQARALSVKGAWETVQHNVCGSLSDELNASGMAFLRSLAEGSSNPGGGPRLPLTDAELQTVFRKHRDELKRQWDDRAVGDDKVRTEYWEELQESLAREEALVSEQNVRLADGQVTDFLVRWQAWLDDDKSTWADGEQICREWGKLMETLPTAPLSRNARSALEAAGRRLANVQQNMVNRTAELRDVKAQLQAVKAEIETARQRERELGANSRENADRHAQLEQDLDKLRNTHAAEKSKMETELQELRKQAAEKQRLEQELNLAKTDLERKHQLEDELETTKRAVAEKSDAVSKLQAQADEYEKNLQEAQKRRTPKCGCMVM